MTQVKNNNGQKTAKAKNAGKSKKVAPETATPVKSAMPTEVLEEQGMTDVVNGLADEVKPEGNTDTATQVEVTTGATVEAVKAAIKGMPETITFVDFKNNPDAVCEYLTQMTAEGRLKLKERNVICPAAPVTTEILDCTRNWYVAAFGTTKRLAYKIVVGYTAKKEKPIYQTYWYDVLPQYLEILPPTAQETEKVEEPATEKVEA